jgi:hypothetical protein
MRKNRFSSTPRFLAAILFFFTCTYLQAQYENGSLVGTIRDTSGAAVFGAVVTITNNATAVTAKVTTNGAGDYEIPSLRVGVYTSQRALQASRAPSRKTSPFQLAVVSASIYR